jgi:porphobilinogen deaminase
MALAQTKDARLLRCSSPGLDVQIVKFETRGDQDQTSKLLRHGRKVGAFVAEFRGAIHFGQLNRHCNAPIAAHAVPADGKKVLLASVLHQDGDQPIEVWQSGRARRLRELDRAVGIELLDKGVAEIIARSRPAES